MGSGPGGVGTGSGAGPGTGWGVGFGTGLGPGPGPGVGSGPGAGPPGRGGVGVGNGSVIVSSQVGAAQDVNAPRDRRPLAYPMPRPACSPRPVRVNPAEIGNRVPTRRVPPGNRTPRKGAESVSMDRRVPAQRLGGADGLAHVVITARDEASAYRVFDALVERFPGTEAPVPWPARPGVVTLRVLTPTLAPPPGPAAGPPPPAPNPPLPPPSDRPHPRPRTPDLASGDNSRNDHQPGKSGNHQRR